jgi:orotidine-5'-phosphate decarboxylase
MPTQIFLAIDTTETAAASAQAAATRGIVDGIKLGLEFFTAHGPQGVRAVAVDGVPLFLDLKLHDIPNTVGAAVNEACKLGVSMLTVHASGGTNMLRAAVEAGRNANISPMILAVTVLTSLDDRDLEHSGVRGTVGDQVSRLAALAIASGCHGTVASAQEAAALRGELGDDFLIVTPGVRPSGTDHGDQARVVTPAEAIAAGANYIVVGRPITGANDPAAEAREILAQIG